MEIKKFDEINSFDLSVIKGQDQYYFSVTNFNFEITDRIKNCDFRKKSVQGQDFVIFDSKIGQVYHPFIVKNNVIYLDDSIFFNGFIYLVQGNLEQNLLALFKYQPGEKPEICTNFSFSKIQDDNLNSLLFYEGDEQVYLIGDKDKSKNKEDDGPIEYIGYFPDRFDIVVPYNEVLILIHGNLLYFDRTIDIYDEEGNWIKAKSLIVVRNQLGKVVETRSGLLDQIPNGEWWIS